LICGNDLPAIRVRPFFSFNQYSGMNYGIAITCTFGSTVLADISGYGAQIPVITVDLGEIAHP